ncbi:diguanylate cyclase with PAS/PAC and GAF sensors [Halothece sp. PCC 7418]|uniref:sensor domain-containing protein n=1 Tax=Halothece sp. (strain PCC 7418) TaxID=65093 RepID=UPI0002A05BB5|nr:diguanylate cyclase [Halothece sp. PCC 7418]AFZ44568.1 diguanylate cyclase with PAS/PAC and GAF sensors [Halothece sp. PCC 7418]
MDKYLARRTQDLRQQAQARLEQRERETDLNEMTPAELAHELEIHQTELEIQYEELQRAYDELRSLHEEFWSLYEFAPCGYVTLNPQGIITRINRRGTEILGTSQAPLTNLGFSRFIAPEYQMLFFTAFREAKRTGERQSLEFQLLPRDQPRLWVHLDLQMRVDENGDLRQWQLTLTDISAEKEGEKAREKAARLQLINDSIQGGIAYVDRAQCFQFVNKTYQTWLERDESEIIGKTIEEIIGSETYSKIRHHIETAFQGQTVTYECQIVSQELAQRDVLVTLVPDCNEQREFEGFYALITDITERKQLEFALREQAEREQLLNSITQSIRQSLNLQEIATHTLKKIVQLFAVNRALLAVANPRQQEFELVRLISSDGEEGVSDSAITTCDYALAQTLFQDYDCLVVSDVNNENVCAEVREVVEKWEARSLLAMPIWYNNELQGVLCLQMCDQVHYWSNRDLDLIQEITDQLAIALRQSQLYEQLQQKFKEHKKLQDQLRYEAIHDQLTGLPNRAVLIDRLEELLKSTPYARFAVLFLDLDGFKSVNDTLGHTIGDQLLIIVGERLANCLREDDLLVRFGGDEFVIVLDDVTEENSAIEVANRIHQILTRPVMLNGVEVTIGTSIGIVFDNPNYTDAMPILRDADIAMYDAKNRGASYVIFNSDR